MSDLISRKWLTECVEEGWIKFDTEKDKNKFIHLVRDTAPSADVQPEQHGHWMLFENQNQGDVNNGNYLYVCSNCNHSDIHAKTVEVPFCWFCGAKMDEVAQ